MLFWAQNVCENWPNSIETSNKSSRTSTNWRWDFFCQLFWYGRQFECSILRSITAAVWFMCGVHTCVQVSRKSLSGRQCSHPQAMRGHWMTWIRGWITWQSWRLSQKPQVHFVPVLIQCVILWPCLGQTNSHTENLGPSYSCVGALLCFWFSVQTIMKRLFMSSCAYCTWYNKGPTAAKQVTVSINPRWEDLFYNVVSEQILCGFVLHFFLQCLQSDLNYLQKQIAN